jgi:predicted HD superfamily hydrolase involved in NAD metabolism
VSALSIPRADEFVARLRQRLSESRVRHCISVAETMWIVAGDIGLNREGAAIAGLLHDMCKAFSPADMLAAASRYNIAMNEAQRLRPSLLHGHVAAHEAKHELGISDNSIQEAIAWHVTGHPKIGPLALALYYADFSEPLREGSDAARAREIYATKGLQPAVSFAAQSKLDRLVAKNAHIDSNSHAFRAWLDTLAP